MINCIIWNGHDDLTPNVRVSNVTPPFECIQNMIEKDYFYGTVRGDPRFVDTSAKVGKDGEWGTPDDGLRTTRDSPATDAGVDHPMLWETAVDVVGNRRRNVGRLATRRYELGAYEYHGGETRGALLSELIDGLRDGRYILLVIHAEPRGTRTAADTQCKEVASLTSRGKNMASEVGRMLNVLGIEPEEVLCGDACGMRQTAAALSPSWQTREHWLSDADQRLWYLRYADLSRHTQDGPRYIVTSSDVIGQMWRGNKGQMLLLDALVIEPRGIYGYRVVGHIAYETVLHLRQ